MKVLTVASFSATRKDVHMPSLRAVETGFMLCLPASALSNTDLAQGSAEEFGGVIGPYHRCVLAVDTLHGRPIKKTVQCLLVDISVNGRDL